MLQDILMDAKEWFPAGVHTELRAQCNRDRDVVLVQGSLTRNSREETRGVSARIYQNGVCGFSSVADYTQDAAKNVLREAADNAAFMDRHAGKGKGALPPFFGEGIVQREELPDTEQKRYIEVVKDFDDYLLRNCPHLTGRTVRAAEDSMEKLLKTSDGAEGHFISPRSFVYIFLNAETKDGTPVEVYAPLGGEGTFDRQFENPAVWYPKIDTLYRQLMDKREGVHAKAGLRTVILGGMMSGILAHESVGHTVEADAVLSGSVAATNLHRQVASEKVSMTDFAHTAFGERCPLPVFLDDEGIVCSDAPLIENGILTGYMHNRESAQHFDVAPTGNARAFLFSDEPLIRMRNTAVHPGKDRLEDMIASVEEGYYLLDYNNGQADATGEFMFGITCGYEIRKGKIGKAILDTTISGVAFDMLKTVDMVGDSVTWSCSGYCGKKQPMPVGMGGPALRCKVLIGGR